MDSHEEEKEPLIEKSHAAGGGANLTAGLNAHKCRGESVAARTRDEQAAMDKYGITFDGESYNFGGRKFVALSHAIKCAEPSPMDKYGITFDGESYNFGGRKFVALSYAIKCAEQPAATVPLTLERHSMSIALVALAAIVVSAIVIYRTPSVSSSGSSSPTQNMSYMLVEQDKIKSRLKDPDSAEFRNVFVSSKYAVCGEVNAKNSFGGYTGFVRFISGGDMQVVESDMAAGEMDKAWPQICKR